VVYCKLILKVILKFLKGDLLILFNRIKQATIALIYINH